MGRAAHQSCSKGKAEQARSLAAKAIHFHSVRARPFVTINCGAIPEQLLESELFGHRRGSFTGAVTDKQGKFEAANRGTIFLDEIGELPTLLQVKILRVLQEREIDKVGETRPIKVDVRVIAATNRNLEKMIADSMFRRRPVLPPGRCLDPRAAIARAGRRHPVARRLLLLRKHTEKLGRPRPTIEKGVYSAFNLYSWPGKTSANWRT